MATRKFSEDRGFLISLEGVDFTWKSPISTWLADTFRQQGWSVLITRDPPYWLSPWDEFQYYFEKGESLSHIAEAFLLLSARLDNWERVIGPALKDGKVVVADRFVDSWFAYQSVRLKGYFGGDEFRALEFLLDWHTRLQKEGFLGLPDLTILIDDDPKASLGRAKPDELGSKYDTLNIQQAVRKMYHLLGRRFSKRIVVVGISGRSISEVYIDVLTHASNYLQKATCSEIA